MFATSLLALHETPNGASVRCLATAADGTTIVHLASGATLRTNDKRAEYELRRRGVGWRVVRHDDRRVEVLGKRFRMTIEVTDREHPQSLDPELFALSIR